MKGVHPQTNGQNSAFCSYCDGFPAQKEPILKLPFTGHEVSITKGNTAGLSKMRCRQGQILQRHRLAAMGSRNDFDKTKNLNERALIKF